MAYRYTREGMLTKRTRLSKSGFVPFIDDLMYKVTNWHYKHYMNRVARAALLSNQQEIDKIYTAFKTRGANNYFRIATANIVPYKRQSNPYCPYSSNYSGWDFLHRQLLKEPRPYRGRRIAGTDLSVPTMPR